MRRRPWVIALVMFVLLFCGATLLGVAIDGDVRSLAVPSPALADRAVVGSAVTVTLVRPARRNGLGAVLACRVE